MKGHVEKNFGDSDIEDDIDPLHFASYFDWCDGYIITYILVRSVRTSECLDILLVQQRMKTIFFMQTVLR